MISVNSIDYALYTTIASNQTIVDSNVIVELNEFPLNSDVNKTPYVGVYGGDLFAEPFRANISNPWKWTYNAVLYIQEQGFNYNTRETIEKLNDLLKVTLTAVDTPGIRDLSGNVDIINEFSATPFQLDMEEEGSLYSYELKIKMEAIE